MLKAARTMAWLNTATLRSVASTNLKHSDLDTDLKQKKTPTVRGCRSYPGAQNRHLNQDLSAKAISKSLRNISQKVSSSDPIEGRVELIDLALRRRVQLEEL